MGPEAVDLREVPEAVAEFQLNAPAQLQLVKAELVPALRPSALGMPNGSRRKGSICSGALLRMFFFRGKPLELDLGCGPQRKIDFVLSSRQAILWAGLNWGSAEKARCTPA